MFGFNPLAYAMAQLGTSFGLLFAVTLIALFIWGGVLFGFLRRRALAARAAARRAAKKPGMLLCAECAATLGPDGRWSQCPDCRGSWLKETDLAEILAKKGKPSREWTPEKGVVTPVCPDCGQGLAAGRFVGEDFAVFRCAPCSGLWFGATERISFELRVLG